MTGSYDYQQGCEQLIGKKLIAINCTQLIDWCARSNYLIDWKDQLNYLIDWKAIN